MYSIAGRMGLRAAAARQPFVLRTAVGRRFEHSASQADRTQSRNSLQQGAKRDPELYILFAIMTGIIGVAAWHFSRSPTSAASEKTVAKVPDSEAWKTGRSAIYQYHPGGDVTQEPRDAPSTLSVVIVPNVNLPKDLHEKYNKYGKEGYDY